MGSVVVRAKAGAVYVDLNRLRWARTPETLEGRDICQV